MRARREQPPTPWLLESNGVIRSIGSGYRVAEIHGPMRFYEGTACLLLTAPELLETCKALIETFENDAANSARVISHAKRVIARAEGRNDE